MLLFLKILSGMANSVDPDQTALEQSYLVCIVCICRFVRNFDLRNVRTFTVSSPEVNSKGIDTVNKHKLQIHVK